MHIFLEPVGVLVRNRCVDLVGRLDTRIAAKLTHPVVVEESHCGRHVDVAPLGVLPDEVVARLLDVARHAHVLGPLLLRVELGSPPRLGQDSQTRPLVQQQALFLSALVGPIMLFISTLISSLHNSIYVPVHFGPHVTHDPDQFCSDFGKILILTKPFWAEFLEF